MKIETVSRSRTESGRNTAPESGEAGARVRVKREEWLTAARDVLVGDGVTEAKILGLSQRLDVSRSSF